MINIIIPAWNCEKYVKQCLDSIFAQDYKDFQVVAVNDGSTDGTTKVLKSYSQKHKNLVILSQKNQGPSAARNTGLDYLKSSGKCSDGDYLIFLDADDWIEPDFLSTLAGLMDKGVALAACGYRWQKQTTKHFKNAGGGSKVLTFDKENTFKQLFIDKYFYGTLWNKLLRWEYAKNLRFESSLWQGEDIYFLSEYVKNLPASAISKYSTKLLYHYQKANGLSSVGFNPRKLKLLDTIALVRQNALAVSQNLSTYVNAWEFLSLIEFIFYSRGRKTKVQHKQLKQRAKPLLKDYKAVKNQYRPFRRYANLIFWCL